MLVGPWFISGTEDVISGEDDDGGHFDYDVVAIVFNLKNDASHSCFLTMEYSF